MNLFGIGPFELLLVVILALIFLGPEELPKAARTLGKVFYEIQHMTEPYREEFARAMQPLDEARQSLTQPLSGPAAPMQNSIAPMSPPPGTGLEPASAIQTAPITGAGDTTDDPTN